MSEEVKTLKENLDKMRSQKKYKVILECVEEGRECPLYKKGDKIVFMEPCIVLDEYEGWTYPSAFPRKRKIVCFALLMNFGPYYRPLVRGIPPKKLGLIGDDGEAYITCQAPPRPSPGKSGSMVFKVITLPIVRGIEDEYAEKELEKALAKKC